jgi:Leucine-rich repeat (LRR) protein
MPLKSLTYLNISHNMISEIKNLEPLRRITNLEVFLNENPLTQIANWKNRLRNIINVLKSPKSMIFSGKEELDERK